MIRLFLGSLGCLCFVFLLVPGASGQPSVSGHVVGAEEGPLPVAHVEVHPYLRRGQSSPLAVVAAAADGRYQLDLPGPGIYRLRFAGPLHDGHEVVVFAEDATPISLGVQLQRAWLDVDQSFTRVTTAAGNFDYNEGVPLVPQPDSSYTATVAAPRDTLAFELPGAFGSGYAGLVVGSLSADAFRYLGQGQYRAFVASPGDSVRIVLRPHYQEAVEPPAAVVAFGSENERAAAYAALIRRLQEDDEKLFQRAMRVTHPRTTGEVDTVALDADRENARRRAVAALETRIVAAPDPFERQLRLMEYLHRSTFSSVASVGRMLVYRHPFFGFRSVITPRPELIEQILDAIPPTSLLWAMEPAMLQTLLEVLGERPDVVTYVERVIAEHQHEPVRRYALQNRFDGLFARHGLTEAVRALGERLRDTYDAEVPALQSPAERGVVPGRRAPERYGLSTQRYETLSPDSLAGKVVLMDFRTEACAVCEADLGMMRARAEVHPHDLAIVRIHLDFPAIEAPADGPWFDVAGEDGYNSSLAEVFGVGSVPFRVLIDRAGVILAAGDALYGEALDQALAEALGAAR